MTATHASLQQIRQVLGQMLGNANDLVRLAPSLSEMVRELPPPDAQLLSRYRFDRAGLYTYVANFFNMPEDEPRTEDIRIPDDCWIRGVNICALPALWWEEPPTATVWDQQARLRGLVARRYGANWRGLVDVDWRIPSQQGFIQDGAGDLLAPGTLVSGDGQFSVPLDWRLKRDDHIIVRCVNRLNRVVDAECVTALYRSLPWVAVVFWAQKQ